MTLTLEIENFHVLDDGGPATVTVPQTGLQVGRGGGMGWVLPDASRHISTHHFDVYHDGQVWLLRDVSMNGTFLLGQSHRIEGVHRLRHEDRFQVGQYIIVALMGDVARGPLRAESLPEYRFGEGAAEAAFAAEDDPWSIGGPVAAVDPIPPERAGRQVDFAGDYLDMPQSGGEPQPAPAAASTDFLAAFARGAGVSPELVAGADAQQIGLAVGQALRVISEGLIAALRDRANARHFTRAADRTMRGATDNNPLKFLPDAEQAIEALFLRPRAGFSAGAAGYGEALDDLRNHQSSVFAALQPALLNLLADLDPGAIEAEAKGDLAGNRKARAWDAYVTRWNAKSAHDNGMLDEFIRLFAEAYREAEATSGKRLT
ncbi:MAG: type VI secretion system-associated FHA domain protein TagH [Paracoccus sp. (in: a-proteobacteria)]|nr:type VI secretion system-associated FHA domain protein TagH [Paracoccus sp. (in: a-proteobacteria)]